MKSVNSVSLLGALTRDIEVKQGGSGASYCRFTVACNFYQKDKEDGCDFVQCVSFGKSAENLGKFFKKGQKVYLEGKVSTNKRTDKDGKIVYETQIVIHEFCFVESKQQGQNDHQYQQSFEGEPLQILPTLSLVGGDAPPEDDLPF